jgi:hypothetical protein
MIMSYSKTWAKQFAQGYDDMVEAQEFQRAEYIVEEGINKGQDMDAIARALGEYSNNPPSTMTIRRWVDKYGLAVGLGHTQGRALSIGSEHLADATKASGVEMPSGDDEYVKYYEEQGATPDVAKRIARAERVGEWMRDNDHWDYEKDRVKPAGIRRAAEKANGGLPHDRWMRRWTTWLGRGGEMLTFLMNTKQDQMRDSTVAKELRRFAAQFEKQAERFETGYEKYKARKSARKAKA